MDKLILFDIDLTLIQSDVYKKRVLEILVKYTHRSEREVEIVREQYVNSLETTKDFHPTELARWVAMALGNNPKNIYEQIWNNEILKDLSYDEVEEILQILSKKNTLGIYSEGFDDLQRQKLAANGLVKYFHPDFVFITRRKVGDAKISSLGKVTVVDDNHAICEMLKDYNNVEVIWLNRKNSEKADGVKTIHNLKELIDEID